MDLPLDFKELLAEFASSRVEAILVGGYAVAFHGRPRTTKDIDLVLGPALFANAVTTTLDQVQVGDNESTDSELRRKPWAWLLRHVFGEDLQSCPHCQGPMRWLEAATTPDAIARLLAKHGLGPRPPPRDRAPFGQLWLAFPKA